MIMTVDLDHNRQIQTDHASEQVVAAGGSGISSRTRFAIGTFFVLKSST
jgi:hypothetical protein